MALAVASSSTYSWTFFTSGVVFNKPSGLAEGDFMTAVIFCSDKGGGQAPFPTTLSGWTRTIAQDSHGATATQRLAVYTKIADATDANASTFTWTTVANVDDGYAGILMRITGNNTSISPVGGYASGNMDDNAGITNPTLSTTLDTVTDDALLVAAWQCCHNDTNFSNFAVSGTNPTWTIQTELDYTGADDDTTGAVATATLTSRATLTQYEVDSSATTLNDSFMGALLVLNPPTAVTVSPDAKNITITPRAPSIQSGAALLVDPVDIAFDVQEPTISTGSSTQWSTTAKSSTTWTTTAK